MDVFILQSCTNGLSSADRSAHSLALCDRSGPGLPGNPYNRHAPYDRSSPTFAVGNPHNTSKRKTSDVKSYVGIQMRVFCLNMPIPLFLEA